MMIDDPMIPATKCSLSQKNITYIPLPYLHPYTCHYCHCSLPSISTIDPLLSSTRRRKRIAKTMNVQSFPTALKDRIVDKIRSNKLTIIVVRVLLVHLFRRPQIHKFKVVTSYKLHCAGTNRLRQKFHSTPNSTRCTRPIHIMHATPSSRRRCCGLVCSQAKAMCPGRR